MRLQPAIDLEEFEDNMDEFGDSERREARRARRRQRKSERRDRRSDRRDTRRERRQERRLDKVQRKQEKVRDKLARVPGGGAPPPRQVRRGGEPSLQPAPTSWPPEDQQQEQPDEEGGWVEDVLDSAQELVEDELDPEGDGGDESTEGMGAWQPFQRRSAATRPPAAARPPAGDGAWGPAVRMGRKLRIQAALGHRAAVIDLKPGLYLVAELPEAVTRTEFGVAPLLAPLMLTAARRAMDEPPRERRGPLASLFRRRRQEPIRYVQVQPVAQPAPASAPLALPGPVAEPPGAMVVPAPDVGWADDATVAAAYGCDRCERERR